MRYHLATCNDGMLVYDGVLCQLVSVPIGMAEPVHWCPSDTTIYVVGKDYPSDITVWPESNREQYEADFVHAYHRLPDQKNVRYVAKSASMPGFLYN